MSETLENNLELLGAQECYRMEFDGYDYVREETSEGDIDWYNDGDHGVLENRIKDVELCSALEAKFESIILTKKKLEILTLLSHEKFSDIAIDIMNLGMTLRQNQLNGSDLRSGNDVLYNHLSDKIKKIK